MQNSSLPLPDTVRCSRLAVTDRGAFVGVGCDDKLVHIYRFQNPSRVAKLEGLTSSPTALTFDSQCHRAGVGCQGGGVRIYDLGTEKLIRVFERCHRAAVTSIDYHSLDEFIFTTGADCRMKVWDVRSKEAIQSYKEIQTEMTVVRGLPDARTVITGCKGGVVRLFDLCTGKLTKELRGLSGEITSVACHSDHQVVAASSSNGEIAVWGANDEGLLFQAKPELSSMDQCVFDPNHLFGLSDRTLTYYKWQGGSFDGVDAGMNKKIAEAQWSKPNDSAYDRYNEELLVTDISIRSNHVVCVKVPQRPPAQSGPKRVFHPDSAAAGSGGAPPPRPQIQAPTRLTAPNVLRQVADDARSPQVASPQAPEVGSNPSRPSLSEARLLRKQQQQQNEDGRRLTPRREANVQGGNSPLTAAPVSSGGYPLAPGLGVAPASRGLSPSQSEEDIVTHLYESSRSMNSLMQRRLTHLKVLRTRWSSSPREGIEFAMKLFEDPKDSAVVVDFVILLYNLRMRERLTLEHVPGLLELVRLCLEHQCYEESIRACFQLTRVLYTRFGAKVEEGLRAAVHAKTGVDLALDARIERAVAASAGFERLRHIASQYVIRRDAVGEEARALCSEVVAVGKR
jgi:hypothetical protein